MDHAHAELQLNASDLSVYAQIEKWDSTYNTKSKATTIVALTISYLNHSYLTMVFLAAGDGIVNSNTSGILRKEPSGS